jgi:uncharacterized membrane protein YsdA (DUF1294 family)
MLCLFLFEPKGKWSNMYVRLLVRQNFICVHPKRTPNELCLIFPPCVSKEKAVVIWEGHQYQKRQTEENMCWCELVGESISLVAAKSPKHKTGKKRLHVCIALIFDDIVKETAEAYMTHEYERHCKQDQKSSEALCHVFGTVLLLIQKGEDLGTCE